MDFLLNVGILVSRICLCSLYLWAGWSKIWDWKVTVAYMQSKKIPYISVLLPLSIFCQLFGGMSVLLGWYARWGSLLLILFTIPATLAMHSFWKEIGPMRLVEKTFFMKDIAILGGLLLLTILGSGSFSLDARM